MKVICTYCRGRARLDDTDRRIWICDPCQAWVGCHKNTFKPLGTLANQELRMARLQAHAVFDQLWKYGAMTRTSAYKWLANQMAMTRNQCHIALFDLEQCKQAIKICTDQLQQTARNYLKEITNGNLA